MYEFCSLSKLQPRALWQVWHKAAEEWKSYMDIGNAAFVKKSSVSTSRSNPECEPHFIATAEKNAWDVRYKLAFRKSFIFFATLSIKLSPNPRTINGKIALFFRYPLLLRRWSGLRMLNFLYRTAIASEPAELPVFPDCFGGLCSSLVLIPLRYCSMPEACWHHFPFWAPLWVELLRMRNCNTETESEACLVICLRRNIRLKTSLRFTAAP